ncbi:hypothetical protein, partial [Longimicrobium sp.]|uniref:hypothetical protein n=1 Tax=Longimicrobium sp. TaxID=2029185 RepID=UPI002F92B4B1
MRLRRFTLTLPLAASLLAAPVLQRVLTAQSSPPAQARTLTDPRYELTVSLDPDRHHLSGSGTLRLPGSPAERQEIRLGLSARYGAFSVEVVSPASAAGPADVVVFDSTPPNRRYRVIPRRPIPANVEPELRLTYSGGEGTEWVYYLGPEGSFAAGSMTPWYPQVLAGEGTLRATGTVTFSVPGPYEVVASGDRRSAHRAGRDTTVRHEVQYRFDRPSFFSFAAGRYLVRRREGRIPILAYVLRDRPSLGQYLDRTAEVISTLELEFGAYPFSEFALVEAPADQARRARFNGASLEGFILASSTLIDAPYNTAFYAHEITHQWWGVTLTPRGYAPLLSEMVSQYGALRVVERLEGQDLAARFRRIGYPGYPSDQSARGFLKLAAAGLDSALEAHTHDVTVAQQLSWGKGMLALDQLAR